MSNGEPAGKPTDKIKDIDQLMLELRRKLREGAPDNHVPLEHRLPVSIHSKLLQVSQLADGVGIALSVQPQWPLFDGVRRAFHRLVLYYTNLLADQQRAFNQGMVAILRQLINTLDRPEPDLTALQTEIASLREEVEALRARLEEGTDA